MVLISAFITLITTTLDIMVDQQAPTLQMTTMSRYLTKKIRPFQHFYKSSDTNLARVVDQQALALGSK